MERSQRVPRSNKTGNLRSSRSTDGGAGKDLEGDGKRSIQDFNPQTGISGTTLICVQRRRVVVSRRSVLKLEKCPLTKLFPVEFLNHRVFTPFYLTDLFAL